MREHLRDGGMTLLEVVLAISILLIGVTVIIKSDSSLYHYRSQREITQQMYFYAAGQLERVLQNQPVVQGADSGAGSPINSFDVVSITPQDVSVGNGGGKVYLESVGVTVSAPDISNPPDPITLYTYRLKPQ